MTSLTSSQALRQLGPEERAAHLASIIEHSTDAILSTSVDGTVLSWNESAQRTFGYTAEEMIGTDITTIIPWRPSNAPTATAYQLREGLAMGSFEAGCICKDGKAIDAQITVSPIYDKHRQLIGISILARDITQQKKMQRDLLEKQKEIEDYIENSVIGLHWVGPDGTILWANKAEMELLGYAPHEYIGQHIANFHVDGNAIDDILSRLNRNEMLHGYEARMKCKDGSIRHVLINSSVLREGDRFVHTRCFTLDVTEKKQAEDALRRAEKMAATGRLAATIAHEVNNPLEAVTNLIYLAEGAASLEEAKEFLKLAGPELARVAQLTKQTLGFFRDPTTPKVFDLSKLVAEVLTLYHSKIEGRNVTVQTELAPSLVRASEAEFRQVIANLLTNALDASDQGGRIRVRVRRKGGFVQLTFCDYGIGIPKRDRNQIYEPFFTTKGERGNGLGLWVSRGIVEKHAGKIIMRSSTTPGKSGTIFSIHLSALGN
jgi:PAS domain S-box-containing protein